MNLKDAFLYVVLAVALVGISFMTPLVWVFMWFGGSPPGPTRMPYSIGERISIGLLAVLSLFAWACFVVNPTGYVSHHLLTGKWPAVVFWFLANLFLVGGMFLTSSKSPFASRGFGYGYGQK